MNNFGIWQEFNTRNDQGKPNRSPVEAATDYPIITMATEKRSSWSDRTIWGVS